MVLRLPSFLGPLKQRAERPSSDGVRLQADLPKAPVCVPAGQPAVWPTPSAAVDHRIRT